jgi:Ca-activated chloride channel family protein
MSSSAIAAAAGLLAACVVSAGGTQVGQFRSGVEVVRVPVFVSDRGGVPVRGLGVEAFTVSEDGEPQRITTFAEGARGESGPLHLGLLLDASGSMEQDMKTAADAAVQFVIAAEEAEDVTFVDFDTSVRLGRFTPPSYPQLFERIRSRKPDGATSLYDALAAYVEQTIERGGQHVLLLLTDGGDSASQLTYPQLERVLRMGSVLLYAIGYLDHQPGTVRGAQRSRLTVMARETGGEAFFPASSSDLARIYRRILADLESRYTLGYVSTNSRADGRFRRVAVRVGLPDGSSARVRARSGYLAARRPPQF